MGGETLIMFMQLLFAALLAGSIYGLIALGYSLIYRASGIMNLSQGDAMCLGGFIGYTLYNKLQLPVMIAFPGLIICCFVIGCVMERFVIRPIFNRNVSTSAIILATVAVSYIIQSVELIIWGGAPLRINSFFNVQTITIGGTMYQTETILCIVVSLIAMLFLHFFMKKTSFGIAMRAAAMDPDAARSCGINVDSTNRMTWGLSICLAGLAGMLVGPLYGVSTTLGTSMSSKGFASAVVGGYGDMYGAIVGGYALASAETFSAGYISSAHKQLVAYIVVLIMLCVKPRGLLNAEAVRD